MHLQLLNESLNRFNECFGGFLYGMNMSAFCVDFPEVCAIRDLKLFMGIVLTYRLEYRLRHPSHSLAPKTSPLQTQSSATFPLRPRHQMSMPLS